MLLETCVVLLVCFSAITSHEVQKRTATNVNPGEAPNTVPIFSPYGGGGRSGHVTGPKQHQSTLRSAHDPASGYSREMKRVSRMFPDILGYSIAGQATIISPYFALTTARAIIFQQSQVAWPMFTSYILGDTLDVTQDEYGNIYRVDEFLLHPDFNSAFQDYANIGLVRVCRPFLVSSYPQLATAEGTFVIGSTSYQYAWGSHPDVLKKVSLSLIDPASTDCATSYPASEFLCTQPTTNNDECYLDNGAALYSDSDNKIYGVVSGFNCGPIGAGYTRTYLHTNWIFATISP